MSHKVKHLQGPSSQYNMLSGPSECSAGHGEADGDQKFEEGSHQAAPNGCSPALLSSLPFQPPTLLPPFVQSSLLLSAYQATSSGCRRFTCK